MPEIALNLAKLAPYFERLVNADLYIQATDGKFYRPDSGWPLVKQPLDCMTCNRWPQHCQKCYETR